MDHSLLKSDEKVSEVLKELCASQARERTVSEAGKIERATFEEATKRLESRVSNLEAELERSREQWVVWPTFKLYVLTLS